MIILKSIESIFSIIIMISLGYFLTSKGWFNEESSKLFSKLVSTISLPALMISNLLSNFDRNKLFSLSNGLIIPFVSMLLCYILAVIVSKLIKVKPGRQGTFQSMFFVSNTIFVGLPVNLALFGEKSVPYVLLYYIANTTFFWTLGVYGISSDSNALSKKLFNLETLKRIFSPPLLGFLFGILLILMQVTLPQFIMDTCKYLGNLTTPLSMLFIGITIHSVNFKKVKLSKDMIGVLAGRFIISPITVMLLCYFIPLPSLMRNVFIIQASMPVMTQTSIISKVYNADYEYAAVMTAVTTIASMISIPIYMLILNHI